MTLRAIAFLLTSTLVTSAWATDVPGSGVTAFLHQVAVVFGGLGLAGFAAGFYSTRARRPLVAWLVPPACALAWMYAASSEYDRYGNLGVVLAGLIPYALCYSLARLVSDVRRTRRPSGHGA